MKVRVFRDYRLLNGWQKENPSVNIIDVKVEKYRYTPLFDVPHESNEYIVFYKEK